MKVATLELGSAWLPYLLRRFRVAFGKPPQSFCRDPIETFREHVWVAPFYEDDFAVLRDLIGIEHMLLGSDWPHPEGLAEPRRGSPTSSTSVRPTCARPCARTRGR